MRLEHFLEDKAPSPSQVFIRKDKIRTVADAIESLPVEQRQVIVLRYWEGKSMQEIAELLGKSTSAVAGLRHRAMKVLRKILETDMT